MSEPKPSRSLSEISHLFLSDVRARQTGGAPMPRRTPPGKSDQISIDLTPEEFDQAFGSGQPQGDDSQPAQVRPVWAVLAAHLPGRAYDHARELARHLATEGQRIGLIELESSGVRLVCFEQASEETLWQDSGPTSDPEAMPDLHAAMEELNTDIDCWLLLIPAPRSAQSRRLMQRAQQWVLLSTCDHEGIVASYRAMKGAVEQVNPTLTLALLDAADETQAERVFTKLDGVCRQFLRSNLEPGPVIQPVKGVAEHAMLFLPGGQQGNQWQTVEQYLFGGGTPTPAAEPPASPAEVHTTETTVVPSPITPEPPQEQSAQISPQADAPTNRQTTSGRREAKIENRNSEDSLPEVIELPEPCGPAELITAMIERDGLRLCPLQPPMYPEARIAAADDGRLVLLVAPMQSLVDLPMAEQAWRWLAENRALVAMAAPGLGIAGALAPALRLLVSPEDAGHPALRPLLHNSQVTIRLCRKLRWADRTGILLDAA